VQPDGRREDREGRGQHYVVELVEPEPTRRIPNGLAAHREKLAEDTARSDALRRRIACMPMADVQRHHLQAFIDALRAEGPEPATLQLEQALYRGFFNDVARIWNWAAPAENPATHLVMPAVDNGRERVMSAAGASRSSATATPTAERTTPQSASSAKPATRCSRRRSGPTTRTQSQC
jgi:hypothetical protein